MADMRATIGLDRTEFETGLAALQGSAQKLASNLGGIFAGALSFGAVFEGLKSAIEQGGRLGDMAEKFGVAGSSLQRLGNVAEVSGASIDDVATALNKAAIKAQEAARGNEKLQEAFAKIGLSVNDLVSASPEQIMMAFSDALASGAIKGQEFSLAVELMGKSATSLIPMLQQGSAAIQQQGEAMGVWSDETIANLKLADDTIKQLGNTFKIAFGGLASLIAPVITAYQKFVEVITLAVMAGKELATGNVSGAKALSAEINRIIDEDRSPKKAGSEGPRAVIGESEQSKKAAEEAEKKKQAELEKTQRLYEQADEIRRRQMLNAMQDEERLIFLKKQRAELQEKISKMPEGMDRAQAVLDAAKLDEQIDPLQKKIEEKIANGMVGDAGDKAIRSGRGSAQTLADSLQQVGGGGRFARIGGLDEVQKDIARTNKEQLVVMKNIERNTSPSGGQGEYAQ